MNLYEMLKARNPESVAWLDRRRRPSPVPLNTDACDYFALYFLQPDGSLWTAVIAHDDVTGETVHRPYKQVRPGGGEHRGSQVVVCMCCLKEWPTYEEARKHCVPIGKTK